MLEQEILFFESIQDELKEKNPSGGYAVIDGKKLLGVWNNRDDALKNGVENFGIKSFLVKNIHDDKIHVINFTRNLNFNNAFYNS